MTIDEVNVTIAVKFSVVITLGLYGGPITKALIAENASNFIGSCGGLEDFIDKVEVIDLRDDEGASLVEGAFTNLRKEPTI